MLEHLETYFNAQKTVAYHSLGFGLLLILLAVLFHFLESNALSNGLKIGCICVGLLSFGGGLGYKKINANLYEKQKIQLIENPNQFQQEEKVRMERVVKSFPLYQIIFIAIIILLLIGTLFLKNGIIQGIMFSVIFLLLGNLIIEKFSKPSIDNYLEQLSNIKN